MASPTPVLDLDGTLVASVNRTTAERGIPPFTAAEITRTVGDEAAPLLRRAWWAFT